MADRTNRTRVAISGYGWIAKHRHAPCFRRAGGEIVAIYHPSDKAGIRSPREVDEFEGLFDANPEVIAICSPPWAHAEQAIRALEKGCHVLVEKPMAMTAGQAKDMVEAAQRSGRVLSVAHSHLFDRAMVKAVNIVESGGIGELTSVHAMFFRGRVPPGKSWLFDLPGGLVFDELPHPIYLMERFLGSLSIRSLDIEAVPGRNTPRQVHVVLRGERGTGQISMIMDSPVSEWHLILTGTKQMLIVDLFRDVLVTVPSDGVHTLPRVMYTSWAVLSRHLAGVLSSGIRFRFGGLYWGHDVLIERFLSAVKTGSPAPVTAEEGLRIQELVDQIVEPALGNGGSQVREPTSRLSSVLAGRTS